MKKSVTMFFASVLVLFSGLLYAIDPPVGVGYWTFQEIQYNSISPGKASYLPDIAGAGSFITDKKLVEDFLRIDEIAATSIIPIASIRRGIGKTGYLSIGVGSSNAKPLAIPWRA